MVFVSMSPHAHTDTLCHMCHLLTSEVTTTVACSITQHRSTTAILYCMVHQQWCLMHFSMLKHSCLSHYTGYPCISMLLANCNNMLQGKMDIDTSIPSVTAHTTRSLSITAVKPHNEAGRFFELEQFLPAVLSLLLHWLPDNVINSDTLSTFKKRLETYFFHCVMWNVLATKCLCIFYYSII